MDFLKFSCFVVWLVQFNGIESVLGRDQQLKAANAVWFVGDAGEKHPNMVAGDVFGEEISREGGRENVWKAAEDPEEETCTNGNFPLTGAEEDDGGLAVVFIWVAVCAAVLAAFIFVLYRIWRLDFFEDYRRVSRMSAGPRPDDRGHLRTQEQETSFSTPPHLDVPGTSTIRNNQNTY
ncbi:uncharacterized protein LOC129746270 [Uranotaenia lowii]|uniref:uncharacterized protein LOC129746270 n=1 Tax=Uranotaenia lowii TaxID=190385 RepID=UPI00247990C6|nr:uncharacterized protein LOC129746270 [Uranotaenia lowii]